jgi:hypothetical protein
LSIGVRLLFWKFKIKTAILKFIKKNAYI